LREKLEGSLSGPSNPLFPRVYGSLCLRGRLNFLPACTFCERLSQTDPGRSSLSQFSEF